MVSPLPGEIQLPDAGTYSIGAWESDGVRIWIDDTLIVDSWTDKGGSAEYNNYTNAVAGSIHRVRVEYYNSHSTGYLDFNWARPGMAAENIPGQYLLPRYGLTTSTTTSESNGVSNRVESTSYSGSGLDPVYGMATGTTQDPPRSTRAA